MRLNIEEKKFRNLMVVYFFIFLLGGIGFYVRPEKTMGDILTLGKWLGFSESAPAKDMFWVILSVAMMMTIAACCFMASLRVRETRNYVIPVLIGKLTSSGLGLYTFIKSDPHGFHYLVISMVDFPLFLIAAVYYIRMIRAEGQPRNSAGLRHDIIETESGQVGTLEEKPASKGGANHGAD